MKLTFSKKGFFALQQFLYRLNDETLKIEAELIQHSFNKWINNHFELSAIQLKYLESIQRKKLFLAFDVSFAIENRLPIALHHTYAIKSNGDNTFSSLPNFKHENVANYTSCGTLQLFIKLKNQSIYKD